MIKMGCPEVCVSTTYEISVLADNGGSKERHWIKIMFNNKEN